MLDTLVPPVIMDTDATSDVETLVSPVMWEHWCHLRCGHIGATCDAWHIGATFDVGHIGATCDAWHIDATYDVGHTGASCNSGHIGATNDVGTLVSPVMWEHWCHLWCWTHWCLLWCWTHCYYTPVMLDTLVHTCDAGHIGATCNTRHIGTHLWCGNIGATCDVGHIGATCDARTWEAEAGKSWVRTQPGLYVKPAPKLTAKWSNMFHPFPK